MILTVEWNRHQSKGFITVNYLYLQLSDMRYYIMNIQLAVEYLDHEVFYITPSTIIDI